MSSEIEELLALYKKAKTGKEKQTEAGKLGKHSCKKYRRKWRQQCPQLRIG